MQIPTDSVSQIVFAGKRVEDCYDRCVVSGARLQGGSETVAMDNRV
jgi:hypothetical protein